MEPPFRRINHKDVEPEEFTVTHANGIAAGVGLGLQCAPDGSLWYCDGAAFYRLNADRKVVHTLGVPCDLAVLRRIGDAGGDGQSRLQVVDADTGAVHVFDADGKKLRVNQPQPGDLPAINSEEKKLAVARDGSAVVDLGNPRERLLFDAEGHRLGAKPDWVLVADHSETWLPRGSLHDMLITTYQAGFLVNEDGKVQRRIDRQADRKWLDAFYSVALAADGSFVVEHLRGDVTNRSTFLTFFSAAGEPLKTLPAPALEPIAHRLLGMNSHDIVAGADGEIYLIDRVAGGLRKIDFSRIAGPWRAVLMRDGRELWVVEYETFKVTRYAMPEAKP